MTKRTRPIRRYPGELERLTTLIERKAKEIAEVLLWDVPDAEVRTVDSRAVGRVARKSRDRRSGKLKKRGGSGGATVS
jgi:hypothetical protein